MNDAEFLREAVSEILSVKTKIIPQTWIDRILRIADEIEPDTQPFRPLDPEDK